MFIFQGINNYETTGSKTNQITVKHQVLSQLQKKCMAQKHVID